VTRVYAVSNTHIDPVWLWRLREGIWVVRNTVRKVLEVVNRSKAVFAMSSAIMYEWLKEIEPRLFDEVLSVVNEGRWEIVGGWIVEPDCNLPCGESYVRHALYGQMILEKLTGRRAVVAYNIDSFGHNAMLPQILAKSGFKYYVFMRPKEEEMHLPLVFWWESPDGSRILAYRVPYSPVVFGDELRRHLDKMLKEYGREHDLMLLLYGRGDHGGGPSLEDVKILEEVCRDYGVEVVHSTIEEYFKELLKSRKFFPVVKGELQHHARGCYSAYSEIKALNRKTEHMLLAAERVASICYSLFGEKYPEEDLRRAWKLLLFSQFHDSLAGTCIPEAYEDIRAVIYEALNKAREIVDIYTQKISSKINLEGSEVYLVVFNLTPFNLKYPVEVEPAWTPDKVLLLEDKAVDYQFVETSAAAGTTRAVFVADLPSLGYRVYRVVLGESPVKSEEAPKKLEIENEFFKLKISEKTGYIEYLYDKKHGVQVFSQQAAVPVVVKDESDTWSHEVDAYTEEEGCFTLSSVELIENGPVRSRIRAMYTYGESKLIQDFILYRNLDFIEVRVQVDWREKHRLLRLVFPINVFNPVVTYEISYGTIVRESNGEEEPGQRWIDVSGEVASLVEKRTYGVTIINDSKYSYSVKGPELRLTVLRSPAYAHRAPHEVRPGQKYLDQGLHEFKYLIFPHRGSWKEHCGKIFSLSEAIVLEPIYVVEVPHRGELDKVGSFLKVSPENVVATVLKKCEKSGELVVRFYEVAGKETKATLKLSNREYSVKIDPYEIKTLKIDLKRGKVTEVNLLEE